jgi:NAD+ diphosphatase
MFLSPLPDALLGAGAAALDRLAHRRRDDHWLAAQSRHPEAVLVPLLDLRHPVLPGDGPEPLLLSAATTDQLASGGGLVLLGELQGRVHFTLDLPGDGPLPTETPWELLDLRALGPLLPPPQLALLAYARGILHWHRRHHFCGDCGTATGSREAGHLRLCPGCGASHFPRTDPAIIALVTSPDGRRVLLARQPRWAPKVYSTLAGFVEPGESLETALAREVQEETGVRIREACYFGSQPWPFPASLMVGFFARAEGEPGPLVLDTEELEDARWLTRDEVLQAVAADRLRLPTPFSIAHALVTAWLEGRVTWSPAAGGSSLET